MFVICYLTLRQCTITLRSTIVRIERACKFPGSVLLKVFLGRVTFLIVFHSQFYFSSYSRSPTMKEILSKIFFVVFVLDRAMQSQIEFEIALIPDVKRGNYVELKTKPTIQMLTKAGTGERERRLKAAIKWWLVIKCRRRWNRIHTSAKHTRNTQIREIYEYNAHKKNKNFNMYKPHTNK